MHTFNRTKQGIQLKIGNLHFCFIYCLCLTRSEQVFLRPYDIILFDLAYGRNENLLMHYLNIRRYIKPQNLPQHKT